VKIQTVIIIVIMDSFHACAFIVVDYCAPVTPVLSCEVTHA